jgi:hypothetical protein
MSIPNIWKNKDKSKPQTTCNVFLFLLPGDDLVHLFDHVSSMFHLPHPWGMSPAVVTHRATVCSPSWNPNIGAKNL